MQKAYLNTFLVKPDILSLFLNNSACLDINAIGKEFGELSTICV